MIVIPILAAVVLVAVFLALLYMAIAYPAPATETADEDRQGHRPAPDVGPWGNRS